MPDDRLLAVKNRAAAQFLSIPGVTAVGLGGRERGGRPTGELVLKVFVARKRPAAELTPGETLPPQFEGVGVDVCELPEAIEQTTAGPAVAPPPQAPPPPPGSPLVADNDTDDTKFRPLTGGARVEVALSGSGMGTLGCFLKNTADANKIYALTNFHVVVAATGGATPVANTTKLGQPTNADGPTKCCSHIIGTFVAGGKDTIRDAALIQLKPGSEWLAEITEIGVVTGPHTVTPAEAAPLTYQVRKRGARTRLTGGIVEAVNTTQTTAGITRHNVMVVKPNPNAGVPANKPLYFSDHGDSGSAVVNTANEVVALHFAGSVAGQLNKGLELPIADIIAQFQAVDHLPVALATATQNGVVNKVPGAPAVAAPTALAPALAGAPGPATPALDRVGADLAASAAGRDLRALWVDHHQELLELVNHRRRVTVAWHRGGGPALLQTLVRMAADPALAMPATVAGEPPLRRVERIHAVLHANASPALRRALDRALAALPDPAALTYDQVLAALAAR
ncbi:MAG TPA: hypothetical protein VKG45_03120 [Actinomycetes bacterium]|nr:hypothetical protein [Actinomycetes bacterium]